jgi:hypothetical protein
MHNKDNLCIANELKFLFFLFQILHIRDVILLRELFTLSYSILLVIIIIRDSNTHKKRVNLKPVFFLNLTHLENLFLYRKEETFFLLFPISSSNWRRSNNSNIVNWIQWKKCIQILDWNMWSWLKLKQIRSRKRVRAFFRGFICNPSDWWSAKLF